MNVMIDFRNLLDTAILNQVLFLMTPSMQMQLFLDRPLHFIAVEGFDQSNILSLALRIKIVPVFLNDLKQTSDDSHSPNCNFLIL